MRLGFLTLRATLRWPIPAMHGTQTPLLQTRIKMLNGRLGAVFQRWYPERRLEQESQAA